MVIYAYYLSYHLQSSQCDYVFHTPDQKHFTYRNYYDSYWNPFMVRFEYDQTPHCCRHTCVSLLATAQVSQTYQKLIVGHKGVNTHRTVLCNFPFHLLVECSSPKPLWTQNFILWLHVLRTLLTRTILPLAVVFFF